MLAHNVIYIFMTDKVNSILWKSFRCFSVNGQLFEVQTKTNPFFFYSVMYLE